MTGVCFPPSAFTDCAPGGVGGFLGKSARSRVLGEVQTQWDKLQTRDGHSSCLSPGHHVCPQGTTSVPSVPSSRTLQPSQHLSGPQKPPKWVQPLRGRAGPVPKATAGTAALPHSSGAGRSSVAAALAAPVPKEKKLFFRAVSLKRRRGWGAARALSWAGSCSDRKEVQWVISGSGWLLGARLHSADSSPS